MKIKKKKFKCTIGMVQIKKGISIGGLNVAIKEHLEKKHAKNILFNSSVKSSGQDKTNQ